MKYTKYPSGRIDCEYDKCGEWHYGGHDLDDLLPDDTLVLQDGNHSQVGCVGCGESGLWWTHNEGHHKGCGAHLAVRVATRFGMIDGAHHKQWVIDQMLRSVMSKTAYEAWVISMNSDPKYDPWDQGIAP